MFGRVSHRSLLAITWSERRYIIQDRGLSQHDLPDHVARLDTIGVYRGEPGASGGQAPRHLLVVKREADHEGCRLNLGRRDREAADLRLPARDGLQHRLDAPREDLTRKGLERHFDRLADLN